MNQQVVVFIVVFIVVVVVVFIVVVVVVFIVVVVVFIVVVVVVVVEVLTGHFIFFLNKNHTYMIYHVLWTCQLSLCLSFPTSLSVLRRLGSAHAFVHVVE